MERIEMIKRIRSTILEWGPFDVNELEGHEAPVFDHFGKDHFMLMEKFTKDNVEVTTYTNEMAIGSDFYSYDDLTDDNLEDILVLTEEYETTMWASREKTSDYDY